MYNTLDTHRVELYNDLAEIIPDFIKFSDREKFLYIMKPKDNDLYKVCIKGIYNMYEKRRTYNQGKQS